MKKSAIIGIIVIGLLLVYYQFGYLLQSATNQPSGSLSADEPAVKTLPNAPAQKATVATSSDPALSYLNLPPGFAITHFSDDVPGARSLTIGDKGTIFVGTRGQGVVYALKDENNDGRADTRYILARNLNSPNGVAFKDGDLYVAEISRILRFDQIESNLANPPEPTVLFSNYPTNTSHGWKYIAFGPDGLLYVPVGAPCNICDSGDPYAALTRLKADFSDYDIVARGIRNTVGFTWHPETGKLWFTDNGRDWLGDDAPPDELNVITAQNQHFGYPYCHAGTVIDPEYGENRSCGEFAPPASRLGPHVAALGVKFYQGSMFPPDFIGRALIAEHGSWNRSTPIGYQISQVDVEGETAKNYRPFIDGWLDANGEALGRPVDLLELPDGSLLISDDFAGAIYRVTYQPNY